jgi:hypothetical protein
MAARGHLNLQHTFHPCVTVVDGGKADDLIFSCGRSRADAYGQTHSLGAVHQRRVIAHGRGNPLGAPTTSASSMSRTPIGMHCKLLTVSRPWAALLLMNVMLW